LIGLAQEGVKDEAVHTSSVKATITSLNQRSTRSGSNWSITSANRGRNAYVGDRILRDSGVGAIAGESSDSLIEAFDSAQIECARDDYSWSGRESQVLELSGVRNRGGLSEAGGQGRGACPATVSCRGLILTLGVS